MQRAFPRVLRPRRKGILTGAELKLFLSAFGPFGGRLRLHLQHAEATWTHFVPIGVWTTFVFWIHLGAIGPTWIQIPFSTCKQFGPMRTRLNPLEPM